MSMHDGRVTSNFVMQAITGKPLTVQGDGRQTRSFCYVSDQIAGLIALMNGASIGPINIGNPKVSQHGCLSVCQH
jgi:UDP-glucuronate decarboxylase